MLFRSGKRLLRRRGEFLERPFAHLYETGAMRRLYLRGHQNILKRVLLHAAAMNLGLLMRTLFGVGTPRGLQGRVAALFAVLFSLAECLESLRVRLQTVYRFPTPILLSQISRKVLQLRFPVVRSFATGC